MTMTLVSTVTVGAGGTTAIEFTSIPQTGTDLFISLSGRATNAGDIFDTLGMIFNSDTTQNYTARHLGGSGSSVDSLSVTSPSALYRARVNGETSTSNTFGNAGIYIPNYAGSTKKSVSIDSVTENNATAAYARILAGLWDGTSAITAVTLGLNGNTWAQYTTASLYTIEKGSGGASVS